MTILVGFIPTPEGRVALDTAIATAKKENDSLVVVNGSRAPERTDHNRLDPEARDELLDALESSGLTFTVVTPENEDEPSEQILEAARIHEASLIVIGLRRRTPVGKFLMGSNSQRVILEADCPVLSVKP